MNKQRLEIGHPMQCAVHWYDTVPEPPVNTEYQGEVIGWKESQLVVRVKGYAVIRFWKANGVEVGNPDHARRGFKINLEELRQSITPATGVSVAIDTNA